MADGKVSDRGSDAQALQACLLAYAEDRLPAGELSQRFRAAAKAWPGLPARYGQVLEKLLEPLEASAMFSEESCAFSRTDLAQSLRDWLQHARAFE